MLSSIVKVLAFHYILMLTYSLLSQAYGQAPLLLKRPSNVTVSPDSMVSLRCAAKGNPLPQIMWTTHGYPVSDSARLRIGDYVSSEGSVISFINISRVSVEEGGRYECTAINDLGSESAQSWINVIGPPFIKLMRNLTVVASRPIYINCPYSVYRLSTLSWFKGDRQLPINRRQTVYPNGTLVVHNVFRQEDEGEYKCLVEDKDGRSAERRVSVRVLVAPTIMPFSFGGNLQEGMRASVTCTITTGDVPIDIQWFKNGQPLTLTNDIHLEKVDDFISTLIFKPLKQDHTGIYSCVASNEASSNNHTIHLSVDSPPQWKLEPDDKSVIEGQSLVIDCQAIGKPEPRVLWKKSTDQWSINNYKTIISGSRVQTLVNGSLYFIEITPEDSGSYMCEASNGIGTPLSAVVKVNVHIPARFTERFQSIKAQKGESIELGCVSHGEMAIKIVWSKDGKNVSPLMMQSIFEENNALSNEYISKFLIRSSSRSDSGLYTCTASNLYGSDERKIELIIQDEPDAPNGLKTSKVNSRSFQIQWNEPFNGNNQIKKYIINYKPENGIWETNGKEIIIEPTRSEAMIRGLSPKTSYHIRVRAENDYGKSGWSEIVPVTTDEEVPDNPPSHLQVSATGSTSIRVSWQAPVSKHRSNTVTGYYIGYKKVDDKRSGSFIFKTVKADPSKQHFTEELSGLEKLTKYTIVVQAYNNKGAGPLSEELYVSTTEYDKPSSPNLKILSIGSHNIELAWDPPSDDNPIFGYFVRYKKQDEHTWHENQVAGEVTSNTLIGLDCGSPYHLSLLAYNSMGRGKSSDIVSVKTQGSIPRAPEKESLLTSNSSFLIVHLSAWMDSDCLIDYFSVQYKKDKSELWTKLEEGSLMSDKNLYIKGLEPACWYNIWISARNGAGTTEAEYKIATLTENGEYLHQQGDSSNAQIISLIVPVISSFAILFALIITTFALVYCHNKSRSSSIQYGTSSCGESQPKAECLALDDISMGKPNYMDSYSRSDGPDPEAIYLASPYASSRLGTPMVDSSDQLRECNRPSLNKHLLPRNSLQSSNTYDVPQQRNHPAKSTDELRVSFLECIKQQDEQNNAKRRAQSQANLLWNSHGYSYGHILYPTNSSPLNQNYGFRTQSELLQASLLK
ncbi:Down syndrome cell adhesion molecule-like protein Dscam2 isoform X1 [Tetranychus urticae]|uniref:Down syndrome cell adhesion molecule-like protein Dscam2 n=1 Tax=Tetranychus urticae TaxID=32264 RepID=T1KH79_TETUR|nr:Down syndrome cell adhesion molecule-like protein Dscam2 isoform X1 [Tetranychus urticae]